MEGKHNPFIPVLVPRNDDQMYSILGSSQYLCGKLQGFPPQQSYFSPNFHPVHFGNASLLTQTGKCSKQNSLNPPIIIGHTRLKKFPTSMGLSEGLVVAYHAPYYKVLFESYITEEELLSLLNKNTKEEVNITNISAKRSTDKQMAQADMFIYNTGNTKSSRTVEILKQQPSPSQALNLERKHYLPNNFNKARNCRCNFQGCQKYPCFGLPGTRPLYCKEHRSAEMVDVKNKKCEEPGCLTRPYFGLPNERQRYCKIHRKNGMVDVSSRKRCEYHECHKQPAFGWPHEAARFCKAHSHKGMDDVNNRRCEFEKCQKHPSYAFCGERPRFCKQHSQDGMVIVRRRTNPSNKETQDTFFEKHEENGNYESPEESIQLSPSHITTPEGFLTQSRQQQPSPPENITHDQATLDNASMDVIEAPNNQNNHKLSVLSHISSQVLCEVSTHLDSEKEL